MLDELPYNTLLLVILHKLVVTLNPGTDNDVNDDNVNVEEFITILPPVFPMLILLEELNNDKLLFELSMLLFPQRMMINY